ncbi:hypothetical protein Patl1_10136 [Pistacia atlantica]|uniref:Uncharacterized protein n=1 Tax=Pistacia atlantica TaxID=434234 RepID=A0ACC1A5V0_9ROSI|nr:hypothetical protein Patl1_10136 [Pistacia atlantica]
MNVVKGSSAQFMQIYRSREVGQSYISSVWTTLLAIAHALWLMIRIRPQVVLCNGPGTCIPPCIKAEVMVLRVPHFTLSSLPAGHENIWSSVFYVEESILELIMLAVSCSLIEFLLTRHHLGSPVSSPQSKQVEKRITLEQQTQHPSSTPPLQESNSKFKSSKNCLAPLYISI